MTAPGRPGGTTSRPGRESKNPTTVDEILNVKIKQLHIILINTRTWSLRTVTIRICSYFSNLLCILLIIKAVRRVGSYLYLFSKHTIEGHKSKGRK